MAAKKATSAKVAEKKAEAKAAATVAAEQTKEAVKKTADATKEVVKETAEKVAKQAKETAEKVAKQAKETAETAKKRTVRKPTRNIVVQYAGKEINEADLTEKAIAQFNEENEVAARKIDLYIKPEENCAYYVINGQYTGRVEF